MTPLLQLVKLPRTLLETSNIVLTTEDAVIGEDHRPALADCVVTKA